MFQPIYGFETEETVGLQDCAVALENSHDYIVLLFFYIQKVLLNY